MSVQPSNYHTIALIMAAGRGLRVGSSKPKQYQLINGRSILEQSIMSFLAHPKVDAVRVVIGSEDEGIYHQSISPLTVSKLLSPVRGGDERSDSVRMGLESLTSLAPKYVLIHDGARPYVSLDLISRVLEGLEHHKGVIPCIPVIDTLKLASYHLIAKTVDRNNLFHAQTPQGFDYQSILNAHQSLLDVKNLTDDASLFEHSGIPVHIVVGDQTNKKITTAEDLKGESMSVSDIRVGHGIDIHAIGPGEHITLLGVKIPAGFSLIGHSDADVGLHSVTDALLGAIGEGDIGQHFSPKDHRWKDTDSSLFLQDAVRRIYEKGGRISHVDITFMGERPKISEFRDQMIKRLAELLTIESSRISVKATTTERLGFIGREEGLACFATATVVF